MLADRFAFFGCLVAAAALGCSGKDHPPFIPPPSVMHANGGSSNGNGDGLGGGAPSGDADGGEPAGKAGGSAVSPDVTLDSQQVYWTGTRTFGNYPKVFSTVAAPGRYTGEVLGGASYAFADNAIWYHRSNNGPVYKFVPDYSGPPEPQTGGTFESYHGNDVIVASKACPSIRGDESGTKAEGPFDFRVSPSGRMLYRCTDDKRWYEDDRVIYTANGAPLTAGTLLALGNGDIALSGSGFTSITTISVLNLADGSEIDTDLRNVFALRAVDDGFDIVTVDDSDSSEASLVHLDAAGATHDIGRYAALPEENYYWSSALGADNALYQFGQSDNQDLFIFRRRVGGPSEIIYTQKYIPDASQYEHYDTPVQILGLSTEGAMSSLFSSP